jgi:hypothetical protein
VETKMRKKIIEEEAVLETSGRSLIEAYN